MGSVTYRVLIRMDGDGEKKAGGGNGLLIYYYYGTIILAVELGDPTEGHVRCVQERS